MVVGCVSAGERSPVVLDHSLHLSTAKYMVMMVPQGVLSGLQENSGLWGLLESDSYSESSCEHGRARRLLFTAWALIHTQCCVLVSWRLKGDTLGLA